MSKVIGLTGQSGAGKTTVCDLFSSRGFGIINCDLTARRVTEDGSECNRILAEKFPECFDKSLKLDRQALAREVFGNEKKLKILNDTIYPYIVKEIEKDISEMSEYEYVILDAPTLFEAGADKLCKTIVSVIADEDIRFKRIKKRDNIPDELIRKRFSSQHSEIFFKERSDFIIENNNDKTAAAESTLAVIKAIKESV